MPTRRLAAGLTAVALLATACGGDDEPISPPVTSPTATETPEPTVAPTETAAAIDVTTVPDEITVEYLEAVMSELDRIEYEMLVDVRDTGEMGEEFLASIVNLWDSRYTTHVAEGYRSGVEPQDIRADARPVETDVAEVLVVLDGCVEFRGEQDLSVLYTPDGLPTTETHTYVRLHAAGPTVGNPTPWRYGYIGDAAPDDSCDE